MIDIKERGVVIATKMDVITNKLEALLAQVPIRVDKTVTTKQEIVPILKKYRPNAILLDVTFIEENDPLITEIVMILNIPLIILSSGSVHHTARTVNAITHGASDFILYDNMDTPYYQEEIINKILHVVSSQKVSNKDTKISREEKNAKDGINHSFIRSKKKPFPTNIGFKSIVAIGTSTGGPKALQTVLSSLPKNFPAPIVIVQHMPSGFTKSLADRLNNICQIRVKEATDGEKLIPGTAYIAPGNYHMIVNQHYSISTFIGEERGGHRPSVNTLFESIAELTNVNKVAVILTGMGKDGAQGVKKMKENDSNTVVIVESEETAIINGMPKATLHTGYVSEVVRLENIGERIIHYIMKRGN